MKLKVDGFTQAVVKLTDEAYAQLGGIYSIQAKPLFFEDNEKTSYEGWTIKVIADNPILKGTFLSITDEKDTYKFTGVKLMAQPNKNTRILYAKNLEVNNNAPTTR
jgi:hypothetical protein